MEISQCVHLCAFERGPQLSTAYKLDIENLDHMKRGKHIRLLVLIVLVLMTGKPV
jgi:hypothetical protein